MRRVRVSIVLTLSLAAPTMESDVDLELIRGQWGLAKAHALAPYVLSIRKAEERESSAKRSGGHRKQDEPKGYHDDRSGGTLFHAELANDEESYTPQSACPNPNPKPRRTRRKTPVPRRRYENARRARESSSARAAEPCPATCRKHGQSYTRLLTSVIATCPQLSSC